MIRIDINHPMNTAKGRLDLNFKKDIESGKITALFGESGAGKTTLLKIIAGLIKPKLGRIEVDNELWFDSSKILV